MKNDVMEILKNTESFNKFYKKSIKHFGPRFVTDVAINIENEEDKANAMFTFNSHEEVNGGSSYIARITENGSNYNVISKTCIKCFIPSINNKTVENFSCENIEEVSIEKNNNDVKQKIK